MNYIRFLPFIVLVTLLGLFGFTLVMGHADKTSQMVGQTLPDFSVMIAGQPTETLTPTTMKKPALLVFWASWCGVCKVDLPHVGRFAKENNLPLYGIAYRDQPDMLRAAVANLQPNVTFAGLGDDKDGDTSSRFGLIGVPTLFAIDKDGIIRAVKAGQASERDLDDMLATIR